MAPYKDFHDFIFEVHLCPSYEMYPGEGVMKISQMVRLPTKSTKFKSLENYCTVLKHITITQLCSYVAIHLAIETHAP